jgi:hypothetical protein
MLYLSRFALTVSAPLAVAALLMCASPAGAKIAANGTSMNGTSLNGISATGSALGDRNGVAVEAVVIPEAASR